MRWFKLSLLEIFLVQFIAWFGLWLMHDYIALLLTSISVSIVFAVLLIAGISERIEPSKVPARYFRVMWITLVAPILALGLFYIIANWGANEYHLGNFLPH